jgi:hypothetical protein
MQNDAPSRALDGSADTSADEPLKALRAIIISCLVFYLVFALALPKLREVSEEEQIIPDLVTWSALEGITRREAAQKATQLGRVPTNLKVFNVSEQDLSEMPDGGTCYKPWLYANSGLEPELARDSNCPRVLLGLNVPGHNIGYILLLYARKAPEGSIAEEILFPSFFAFPPLSPDAAAIQKLPAQNYAIVKMRPLVQGAFPFVVMPRTDALKVLKIRGGGIPAALPFPGPVNPALVDRVLWRAGKRNLMSPLALEEKKKEQLEELDLWLAERLKNPPQITVFGASMDLTLASSLFGLILALFAFATIGPLQDVRRLRGSKHSLSWTMVAPTITPDGYSAAVEFLACLLSLAFVVGPIALIGLQLGYGILRPLGSIGDFAITTLNCGAAIAAAAIFTIAGLELRYRRKLKQ